MPESRPEPKSCRKNRESGFTFLEVLVALAIVSGALVTLISTMNLQLGHAASTKSEFRAALLAKEKLEEIRLGIEREASSGDFPAPNEEFSWEYDATAGEALDAATPASLVVRWGKKSQADEFRLSFYETR